MQVINSVGFVTSDPTLVTVNVVPPAVTIPPSDVTVVVGGSTTLTAAYSGSLPRTYQWYKDTGSGPVEVPGATSSSYTIGSATLDDAGSYHVVVTNEASSATSEPAVVSVVFASESTVFSTDFTDSTLNNAEQPITTASTSWFVLASRTATNSHIGDDPATTEVVEERPLKLTFNTTTGSSIVEGAARFTATPITLDTPGDYIRLTATLNGRNLRILAFGLYDSGAVNPYPLMGDPSADIIATGGSNTAAVGIGTQNWVGYRASVQVGGSTGDIGTRPAQVSATTNRGNELLMPPGSTGAAHGDPAGVPIGAVPSLPSSVTLADATTYTVVYSITRSGADQLSIGYSIYTGESASGTPLYSTGATTTAAGALPSVMTDTFDAVALGFRNLDTTSIPELNITHLKIDHGVAGAPPTSAYSSWASLKGLSAGVNDGAQQDPDQDGVANLLEFVLGGDPLAASPGVLPVVAKSGANLTFAYNVEVAATSDYDISAESSTDLATWTTLAHGVNGVTIDESQIDADTDHVVVTLPASGPRIFVRLRITPNP